MPELLIILAIVVLLFGAKKIPDLAKGMGTGIKNFKKAMSEDEDTAKTADAKKIEEEKTSAASTEAKSEETKTA